MSVWSGFLPARCLPDNCDCEFVRDALIAQPSAFWSSAAYLFFALLLYRQTPHKNTLLKLWTLAFCLLGLSSHFAHASFIEFALAMDFGGIILVMSFFFMMKWFHRLSSSLIILIPLMLLYYSGLAFAFYSLEKWFKVGLCVAIFLLALFELLYFEGKSFFQARELHWALLILTVSFTFFLVDELKLMCDPHSWLQGHSLWHVGTALTLYLYGKWRFRSGKET